MAEITPNIQVPERIKQELAVYAAKARPKGSVGDTGLVIVYGMPHGGTVAVDGEVLPNESGRWYDATYRHWIVAVPVGRHALSVRRPDGPAQQFLVNVLPYQPIIVTYQSSAPAPVFGEIGPAPGSYGEFFRRPISRREIDRVMRDFNITTNEGFDRSIAWSPGNQRGTSYSPMGGIIKSFLMLDWVRFVRNPWPFWNLPRSSEGGREFFDLYNFVRSLNLTWQYEMENLPGGAAAMVFGGINGHSDVVHIGPAIWDWYIASPYRQVATMLHEARHTDNGGAVWHNCTNPGAERIAGIVDRQDQSLSMGGACAAGFLWVKGLRHDLPDGMMDEQMRKSLLTLMQSMARYSFCFPAEAY